MNKEIEMREIVNFCNNYNAIGYGKARIIELPNKFIIELYNCGFSENEEMDTEFRCKYEKHIIYDRHPCLIAEFTTLNLKYNKHIVNYGNLKDWCSCYEKVNEYRFQIEID